MSARATGADAKPDGEAKHRQHHDGSSGRAYTVEQKAAVIRIRRCSPTAFYEILGLEEVKTTCGQGEIKKAYRKLSLLTHPDKNGYAGADEAFKMVSRAFSVLSDPDKKAKYDRFGGDPESRFPGASAAGASPFSGGGFARSGAGGRPQHGWAEEEISPEEMFRQFFGGGMGGPFGAGLFDTGPGFVFNLGGGPGIRVHQFGGPRPRRRPGTAQPPGQEAQPSLSNTLSSLLPLLFLFILPLLSSFFGSGSTQSGPSISLEGARPPLSQMRTSSTIKIPYWVDPVEVEGFNRKQWKLLDQTVEKKFIHTLNVRCELETQQQTLLMQEAQGWFSVDHVKEEQAKKMKKPNCERLTELGITF